MILLNRQSYKKIQDIFKTSVVYSFAVMFSKVKFNSCFIVVVKYFLNRNIVAVTPVKVNEYHIMQK